MSLFTITATPVQNLKQMIEAGYTIDKNNSVAHINQLHLEEYSDIVAKVLGRHGIDGFTMYQVNGYWKGIPEVSFKIEIAIDKDANRVYEIAAELKNIYNQEGVMLTLPNNTVKFI